MGLAKATPRPWAWEWDEGSNNITIFQPSQALHCCETGEVYCEDHKDEAARRQAEDDAELIVSAVNSLSKVL